MDRITTIPLRRTSNASAERERVRATGACTRHTLQPPEKQRTSTSRERGSRTTRWHATPRPLTASDWVGAVVGCCGWMAGSLDWVSKPDPVISGMMQ